MIENVIQFAALHEGLGYSLKKGNDDCGRFQFIGGEWRFRVNRHMPWAKVGTPYNLHLQLQAWRSAEDCNVMFWQCAWCRKPGADGLAEQITQGGGKMTHGCCDACQRREFPELDLPMAA